MPLYSYIPDATNSQRGLVNTSAQLWAGNKQLIGNWLGWVFECTVTGSGSPEFTWSGDTDTGIEYASANSFKATCGGVNVVQFNSDSVVVNEGGANVDFRVEGNNQANLFVIDAENDHVSITSAANNSGALATIGAVQTNVSSGDLATASLALNGYISGNTASSNLVSRTLIASWNNHLIGGGAVATARCLDFVTNTATGTSTDELIHILLQAGQQDGTVTTGVGLYIANLQGTTVYGIRDFASNSIWQNNNGGIVVGAPTGGYKGAGTINAQAIYDDNVLLTDWVFDLAYDSQVCPEDESLHGQESLWTIDETQAFTEDKRHLPSLPSRHEWQQNGKASVGELVTKLWETIERQQLHIFELNNRLKRLEA